MNSHAGLAPEGPYYTFVLIDGSTLKPHEETDMSRVKELTSEITGDGMLRHPVIVDKTFMVILDGHHRVSVLTKLGCMFIPAYLVDYHDESIQVRNWREGKEPEIEISKVTKENVVSAALTGQLFPPKTSRHIWPWRREECPIPIRMLEELGRTTSNMVHERKCEGKKTGNVEK